MNYSICLDQFSTNFNVNNLSSNGFSIYTNLDNFTNPIAQNIPYQDLFSPPIGNCPYVVNLPQGATQLVVIDACTTIPTSIASIFSTGSNSANTLTTECCYAVINVPVEPISWCDTADLSFDVFSASFVGQIIAGNLNSSIGSVTDYTIGWYKDGNYSSPEFISGYGNAFLPYQLTHPLAGNTAPYVTAGDWEGIIHDIAINGVTYSSVSGSANGTPIPFESCFGTIVVAPLECDNGTFPLPYTHQKEFTAAGNGAPPPIISTTYNLSDTTEYFVYDFQGFSIWDELEIKFISGDPNNTGNPSLYSQPIYLEKVRVGTDNNLSTVNTPSSIANNVYPKQINTSFPFKRVLTLTNISRSANPSLPDSLDIKISPNPTNFQTNWKLRMQCLDTFNCDDCIDPFSPIKISTIVLDKICCGSQKFDLIMSGSCNASPQLWNYKRISTPPSVTSDAYTNGYSGFAGTFYPFNTTQSYNQPYFYPSSPSNCNVITQGDDTWTCSPVTPNSSIGYYKDVTTVNGQSQGIISMSFNSYADFDFYKSEINAQEADFNNLSGPITYNPTIPSYYAWFKLNIPTSTVPCGDGVPYSSYYFHRTAYPNITYVNDNNPNATSWEIIIPQPLVTNQIPQTSCSNCWSVLNTWLPQFNDSSTNIFGNLSITNNFGSKSQNPIIGYNYIQYPPATMNYFLNYFSQVRKMPLYSFNTLPFISSSAGWVNLPTLGGVPCPTLVTSSMPYTVTTYGGNNQGAYYFGYEQEFIIYFPNLTGSSDWFQLYTNVTSSNGYRASQTPYNLPIQYPGNLIYEYSASISTVYSSSYFIGGSPILDIDTSYPTNC